MINSSYTTKRNKYRYANRLFCHCKRLNGLRQSFYFNKEEIASSLRSSNDMRERIASVTRISSLDFGGVQ